MVSADYSFPQSHALKQSYSRCSFVLTHLLVVHVMLCCFEFSFHIKKKKNKEALKINVTLCCKHNYYYCPHIKDGGITAGPR